MKLKAQSSKLKISSDSEAPNEIAVHGPGILALDFILSFELWIWSFYPCLVFGAICDFNDHLASLIALAERYSDRKPDFADLCLIRMSELNPDHSIITTDREDFRVYRRNKRGTIPLVCPPEI